MKRRSCAQNKKFSAIISDVVKHYPLAPWKAALAREAFKRYFIAIYVREARWEAYGAGQPDPFPVRPVPSSELTSWQADELIECTLAHLAMNMNLILQ